MILFERTDVTLVTLLKESGEVDYEKLKGIVEEQIVGGTDAIIACSTTDEASTMAHGEHLEVIEYICRATKKWIPVVAGIGSSRVETATYLFTKIEKGGAGEFLLVSPYYSRAAQKGPMAHSTVVASAVKISVILYNIPGRIGVTIKPETTAVLCKDVDNVMEIKEAGGSFSAITILMSLSDGKVDLHSGNDDQIVPLPSLGGKDVVSVLSNVAPRQTHDICTSYFAGDVKASASLQLKVILSITELFNEVSPIFVEVAMNMMGKGMGPLRMPSTEMEPQNQEELKKAITNYGTL